MSACTKFKNRKENEKETGNQELKLSTIWKTKAIYLSLDTERIVLFGDRMRKIISFQSQLFRLQLFNQYKRIISKLPLISHT